MRYWLKSILYRLGILNYAKSIRHKFRSRNLNDSPPIHFNYDGISVAFHTNDAYSHGWFYPRYKDGTLHEALLTELFLTQCKSSVSVADIGSNLGWFTCFAAKINPNATVYAFELDPSNAKLCQRNISLNQLTNVVLENTAVSANDGNVRYSPSNVPDSMHRIGKGNNLTKSIALDSFFSDKPIPNVIKIDVEGAEVLVLEGMTSILRNNALKTIFIEIHPMLIPTIHGSVKNLFDILENNRFLIRTMEHRSADKRSYVDSREIEEMKKADIVLVAERE